MTYIDKKYLFMIPFKLNGRGIVWCVTYISNEREGSKNV